MKISDFGLRDFGFEEGDGAIALAKLSYWRLSLKSEIRNFAIRNFYSEILLEILREGRLIVLHQLKEIVHHRNPVRTRE